MIILILLFNLLLQCILQNDYQNSLSSLSITIITEEMHKLFYYEEKEVKVEMVHEDIEHDYSDENVQVVDENNINLIDAKGLFDNDIVNTEMIKKKQDRNKSIWAKKRAKLNKKPKFKLVPVSKEDCKRIFKKTLITPNQLTEWMEKERNSDTFLSKSYKCNNCVISFDDQKTCQNHSSFYHNKVCIKLLIELHDYNQNII